MTPTPLLAGLILALLAPAVGRAQVEIPAAEPTPGCEACPEWNSPQGPVRIYGNSYWVGTRGLGAILIASEEGHILLDGGLRESARGITQNIRELGFELSDVRLILNSHAHFDHAGGIAALQRASGASVAASPASARVLETGESGPDDPQHGLLFPMDPVAEVRIIADGETVRVGPLALTAHFTAGHTPGGTSWSWESCEGDRCLGLVYGDSQTPVSADGFFYTRSESYPTAMRDFERSFARLEGMRCDILITPHPGASRLWERMEAGRDAPNGVVDPEGCRRYAAVAREALARRVAREQTQR